MAGLSEAGFTIGDLVRVNAKHRHTHNRRGVVTGFNTDIPGVLRVRVSLSGATLSFDPRELVMV